MWEEQLWAWPVRVAERERAEEGSITPFACAMYGQVAIAKWVRQHPNWAIGKGGYKCRPYKMTAKA